MNQYQGTDGLGYPGSVRRAREQAEADNTRSGRPQAPPGTQGKDGQLNVAISRPSPMPQWPLPGSIQSPISSDSEPYRPPAGSRPPQRPPRPSLVPSILDSSRVQEHTPVFQYTPQDYRASEVSMPDSLASPKEGGTSRPLTQSSVGSIPDFPLPGTNGLQPPPASVGPPRRSVNLGPPPSSRRGQSSFYSTASFVSPIPEESPRRSRASIASSAAIPQSFGNGSPVYSPNGSYFDDEIIEESVYGDGLEERGLVRSASIGKRGKPSLVTTKTPDSMPRPGTKPIQGSAYTDGASFFDGSSSSSGDGSFDRSKGGMALTTNTVLSAYEAASASDPSFVMSPKGRMSAIRRPPRLDIDAVREAEARGSLTSLPDLIKRATRLAALMDKGRRPASRLDELMFTSADVQARRDRDFHDSEKYQSGLSDMLAAFPPPAATSRQSTRQSAAWPFGLSGASTTDLGNEKRRAEEGNPPKWRGCCCGLPKWAVVLIILILLCIVAAAVVVPLKLTVFKDANAPTPAAALEICQNQVKCQNGGTNVITNGACACICSNGFTGPTCTIASAQGCTTTSINTPGGTTGEVTLGQSIPRLLEQAQRNFSIPLTASAVLSKFSSSNLTCTTQNALVTFGGSALQLEGALQEAVIPDTIPTITTVLPGGVTLTLRASSVFITTLTQPTTLTGSFSTILTTVVSNNPGSTRSTTAPAPPDASTPTTTPTRTSTSTAVTPAPTSTFQVTDRVVDFARIAVLYILQETTLNQVASSQNLLQKFFDKARANTNGVTVEEARKVDLGAGMTIDFVGFFINLGKGNVGGGVPAGRRRRRAD